MLFRIRMDLAFPESAEQYADQIRDALLPLYQNAVVINEGGVDEERGYIEVEECRHDEGESCTLIARWEVGLGRVI